MLDLLPDISQNGGIFQEDLNCDLFSLLHLSLHLPRLQYWLKDQVDERLQHFQEFSID